VGSWADARGASAYAPALVQSTADAKPVYSASARTITFDGTDDYLRATSATWNTITAACAVIVVGTLPSTVGSEERVLEVAAGDGTNVIGLNRAASNGNPSAFVVGVATASITAAAGTRVFHGRRTAASGGNVTVGARLGAETEVTSTGAGADKTANAITLGASRATALFADTIVRSLLVLKGGYTSAQQVAVNEWARAVHGASI
jgi:hypothetical protein